MRTKFTLLLFFLFFGLNVCRAALPEGYTMVTNISALQNGDRVVLYSTAISLGVTGWDGKSDATVAASGWAEYIVETTMGGVYLKDAAMGKYISNPDPAYNTFAYSDTPSLCTLKEVSSYFMCGARYLSQNGTNYRFHSLVPSNTGSYKPFFLYKVPAVAVEAPMLSPAEGTVAEDGTFTTPFLLTIACATEGAQIYYTLDSTDPTTSESRLLYQSPLTISETTTLRVIATDGTNNSKEVSATYLLEKGYAESIAEFIDAAPTTSYELRLSEAQNAVIIGVQTSEIYLQDNSGKGIVLRTNGLSLPAGAVSLGNQWIGTLFGTLGELERKPLFNATQIGEDLQSTPALRPTPTVITAIDADTYVAHPLVLVKIEDVTFGTDNKIVKDGVVYKYYDEFGVFTNKVLPDETVHCNLTGIMTQYYGTVKIVPVLTSDIDTRGALAELPTINPVGGATQDQAVSTDEVRIKLAANTTIKVNGVSYTNAEIFSITEENTSLTITSIRDFYTDNTVTLWYKPATPTVPSAVIGTVVNENAVPQKRIVNDQLIIIGIDNNVYNAQGIRIE